MAGEYVEFVNNSQPALNEDNLNLMQQRIKQDIQGAVSGDTLPVGAIMPFGSDTIPENWLLCNGQAVSRTEYQQLFNTIGTTFGQGDGFTTFNLPNLKGKVVVGKDENDEDFDLLGETGGEKEHTLTIDEMPEHRHGIPIASYVNTDAQVNVQQGGHVSNQVQGINYNTNYKGGGQPHNILQPYIVQNYIIKAKQSAGIVATVVDSLNSTSATDALSANQGSILNERFNYSTEEKVIGRWIDGKTLYEKTITGTKVADTDLSIDIADLNIDVVFIAGGALISNNNIVYELNRYETNGVYTRAEITNQKTIFKFTSISGSASGYVNGTVIAIIRYTKTTD